MDVGGVSVVGVSVVGGSVGVVVGPCWFGGVVGVLVTVAALALVSYVVLLLHVVVSMDGGDRVGVSTECGGGNGGVGGVGGGGVVIGGSVGRCGGVGGEVGWEGGFGAGGETRWCRWRCWSYGGGRQPITTEHIFSARKTSITRAGGVDSVSERVLSRVPLQ